jgi:NAD-dependent deacetylase
MAPDSSDPVSMARTLVARAGRIVGLTGAGISTDSGIPDYRGPEGVWTKNPGAERMANIDAYMADAEIRRRAWRSRVNSPIWMAEPNPGHHAFVELERQGRLDTLVTQNIDGLHQLAGSDPTKVVELHGTFREVICMGCGDRGPSAATLDRVRGGEDDPSCLHCGGVLKSATISFGEQLVVQDLLRAEQGARQCDLLLVVGTSLGVYPAAGLVPLAVDHGAAVIVVNGQPTPYDRVADAVVREPISTALPRIVRG